MDDILAAIPGAADADDPEELGRLAHSIKSASANLGAQRLSQLASALEEAARESAPADLADRLQTIRDAYGEARTALECWHRERPSPGGPTT
jgi:HPt (histidine-containing phosphotransfer) domain-containing protein